MSFLGIDLGTSEVKAALVGEDGVVLAAAAEPLVLSHPHPAWSEQHPDAWWRAVDTVLLRLAGPDRGALRAVQAIGVSGQMHGAVVLDERAQVLRPAILWNDSRSARECVELESEVTELRSITGNLAMPGFTAPKLRWLRRHEPELFAAIRTVLLPKDWLVLQLCGEPSSEMSDASGTLWLDVGRRRWSETMLAASGLSLRHMPALHEGSDAVGVLHPALARRWGIGTRCVIAAGAGDNAAAAIGLGATEPGQGFVSLGTSGVAFLVSDGYRPRPEQAVHAFCHALPQRWHQMGVMLSAAASLQWAAHQLGHADVPTMMAEVESVTPGEAVAGPLFLPYLSGERSPHNDPAAGAVFFGLRASHSRALLAHAVAEGVAFAMTDCLDCIEARTVAPHGLGLVGGAARSERLRLLLASASGITLRPLPHAAHAAALGAASLARLAAGGGYAPFTAREDHEPLPVGSPPDPDWSAMLAPRLARFRALYGAVREHFPR